MTYASKSFDILLSQLLTKIIIGKKIGTLRWILHETIIDSFHKLSLAKVSENNKRTPVSFFSNFLLKKCWLDFKMAMGFEGLSVSGIES